MADETPKTQPEPVRGPGSGIQVPDSAVERHLREAAEHVKPAEPGGSAGTGAAAPPDDAADTPHKRPSADRDTIADPWKPDR